MSWVAPERRSAAGDVSLASAPVRILIVDDHRTFAELLALALERETDLTCVGHARTSTQALDMAASLQPDLVIMDVRLAEGDGIATTAQLTATYPGLRVIVLTGHMDAVTVTRAAQAGACGFLPKDGALEGMLHALRSARCGSLVLQPEVVALMTGTAVPGAEAAGSVPPSQALPVLTPRELQVLDLLARGHNPRVIARLTGLPVDECRAHLSSVMGKLDARSQLEAVVTANRFGLISVGA
ncbi:MAG TPA: response regulator transcription factor [Actinomycetales bacterium]